jgi:hypothetical protein
MTTPTTLRLGVYGLAAIMLLWKAGAVALLGMFATGGYLLVRKRTSPPAKAGASVLLPLAVGLTIVAAAVALLNVALEYSPTSVSVAQLTELEDFVHTLPSRLPSYLTPGRSGWPSHRTVSRGTHRALTTETPRRTPRQTRGTEQWQLEHCATPSSMNSETRTTVKSSSSKL